MNYSLFVIMALCASFVLGPNAHAQQADNQYVLQANPIIERLERGGIENEKIVELSGYIGTLSENNIRLYESLSLDKFYDIPRDAILHSIEEADSQGRVKLFVSGSASIVTAMRGSASDLRYPFPPFPSPFPCPWWNMVPGPAGIVSQPGANANDRQIHNPPCPFTRNMAPGSASELAQLQANADARAARSVCAGGTMYDVYTTHDGSGWVFIYHAVGSCPR